MKREGGVGAVSTEKLLRKIRQLEQSNFLTVVSSCLHPRRVRGYSLVSFRYCCYPSLQKLLFLWH